MTVKITKPALNLREEIAKAQSNNAEEARIGLLVTDSLDAVAIDAELLVVGGFTSTGIDDNATSTAVTLDSSGNVLVGTVSTDIIDTTPADTSGVVLRSTGRLDVACADSHYFNRVSTDGNVLTFRKDGATVGSIGTASGSLYLGNSTTFTKHTGGYLAPSTSSGGNSNGGVGLGYAGNAFSNLYLSGGVHQSTVTVASLPAASSSTGYRYMVSDSTVAGSGNFGATVAGGGSNVVPVYSDGTNWKIG